LLFVLFGQQLKAALSPAHLTHPILQIPIPVAARLTNCHTTAPSRPSSSKEDFRSFQHRKPHPNMDSPTVPSDSFDLIFGTNALPAAPPPTLAPVCEPDSKTSLAQPFLPASQWKGVDNFGQNSLNIYITMPVTEQQATQTAAPVMSPTDSIPAASKRPKRRATMTAGGASAALGRSARSTFSSNTHNNTHSNNMSQRHIAASQVEEDNDLFNFDDSCSSFGSEHRYSCSGTDIIINNSNNNNNSSRASGTGRRCRNDPQRNARLAKENRERKKAYIAGLEAELEEMRTAEQEADRVGGEAVREAEQLRAENAMLRTTLSEQRALAPIFHAMQTVPGLTFVPPAEAGSKRAADADSSGGNVKRMLPLTFLVQLSDPPGDGVHRS
jgi:hypothetical protein